jgi:hypothetical protein
VAAETGDPPAQEAIAAVRRRASLNGLELSDAEARDLRPYFAQHQRWLAKLRGVLGAEEEPATRFLAEDARDARA